MWNNRNTQTFGVIQAIDYDETHILNLLIIRFKKK